METVQLRSLSCVRVDACDYRRQRHCRGFHLLHRLAIALIGVIICAPYTFAAGMSGDSQKTESKNEQSNAVGQKTKATSIIGNRIGPVYAMSKLNNKKIEKDEANVKAEVPSAAAKNPLRRGVNHLPASPSANMREEREKRANTGSRTARFNGPGGIGLRNKNEVSPMGRANPAAPSLDRGHPSARGGQSSSGRGTVTPSSAGGSSSMQGPAAPFGGGRRLEVHKLLPQDRSEPVHTEGSAGSGAARRGSDVYSSPPHRVHTSASTPSRRANTPKDTNNEGSTPVNPAGYSEPGAKGTVERRTLNGVGGADGKLVVGEGMHASMGPGDTANVTDAESGVSANFGVTSSTQGESRPKNTDIGKTMDGVNGGRLSVGDGMHAARESNGSATVTDARSGAKATFGAENIQNGVQGGAKGSESARTLRGVGGAGGKLVVGEGMHASMGPGNTMTVRDDESGVSANFGVTSSTRENGGKKPASAGGKPSGGKYDATSGGGKPGKHDSSSNDKKPDKPQSSSGDKKPRKQGSSSDEKKPSKKDSSSDDEKPKKPDSKDEDKPDKNQGKTKLGGEGDSGIAGGDSAQDVYDKLHKPGSADTPSNGGNVRGDVSRPGAAASGSSATGSQVGRHIQMRGTGPAGVVTGDRGGSKSPLNMVDPGRFGSRPMTPTNSAADQLEQHEDAVNPTGG